jgi:hypothetical protein
MGELGIDDESLLHDLRLLITELIANRVANPAPAAAAWLELNVDRDEHHVRVELNDVGPRRVFEPAPYSFDPEESSGWGLSRADASLSVWFEIDLG